jgi:hypothetical protein
MHSLSERLRDPRDRSGPSVARPKEAPSTVGYPVPANRALRDGISGRPHALRTEVEGPVRFRQERMCSGTAASRWLS